MQLFNGKLYDGPGYEKTAALMKLHDMAFRISQCYESLSKCANYDAQ